MRLNVLIELKRDTLHGLVVLLAVLFEPGIVWRDDLLPLKAERKVQMFAIPIVLQWRALPNASKCFQAPAARPKRTVAARL